MRWDDVGSEADQVPGTGRSVIVSGTAIALFRTADGWIAVEDRCPHAGAPLSAGLLRDGTIVCAWHGWRFDAACGTCLSVPGGDAA
jgi:nitrite reductase/ring-hydroxylating ferredoxin subunit